MGGSSREHLKEIRQAIREELDRQEHGIQEIHVKLNRQEEVLSVISRKLSDHPVKTDNSTGNCRHGYEASDEASTDSSCCSNSESTGMYQICKNAN
jgi:hypothetical protein